MTLHFRPGLWLVVSFGVFVSGWFIPINVKGEMLLPIGIAIRESHVEFPAVWTVVTVLPSAAVGWLLHFFVGMILDWRKVKKKTAEHKGAGYGSQARRT